MTSIFNQDKSPPFPSMTIKSTIAGFSNVFPSSFLITNTNSHTIKTDIKWPKRLAIKSLFLKI